MKRIFKEIPPTAGLPIGLKDFFTQAKPGSLEEDFCSYLGVDFAKITYSGTAAFYFILESLKEISPKSQVVIPAYICPLIPLAIKRAGLKVKICDIRKYGFDFDQDSLADICQKDNDILAVVAVHLAGIPVDLDKISQITRNQGIFLIEDCAQSLGAEFKGKKVGSFGDFSFYSLCRGKGLTIYEGGVLVAKNKEYYSLVDKKIKELEKGSFFSETLKILELIGYSIFYKKELFWFIFGLPQAFWKALGNKDRAMIEYFAEDFPVNKVSNIRKRLVKVVLPRLDNQIQSQRKKVSDYLEVLDGLGGVKPIKELPGSKATFPFLTLIFDDPIKQKDILGVFDNSGLGVSTIYNSAITDYGYLKEIIPQENSDNARWLCQREVTLSTSLFLDPKDQEVILNKIRFILAK